MLRALSIFSLSTALLLLTFPSCTTTPSISGSPNWAQDAVWYQIFPERFHNGDPSNDPRVEDLEGSWPHERPGVWAVSSWTGDWYALQGWERSDHRDFYYRAQQRRYGGDLQGIIDKLDYLNELGVNALYLNPIFEAPSLHKYDATMYHHVDNNFGPDPAGDEQIWKSETPSDPKTWQWTSADKLFLQFVSEAHARGMKVIIDGVFNHVGMTHWAFLDVKKNGKQSPYRDWFIVRSWDDPTTSEDEFDYAGWYGVRELPEINEDKNGIVSGPREHVHDILKRWMDPNGDGDPSDGVDGWRLDVAEMVALPFWKQFRIWVREINPNAYLVGEVWWEDWKNSKMFNAAAWLEGDAFDAVMNYRVAREAAHFFKDKRNKIGASAFDSSLMNIRRDYRDITNKVIMNVLGSHDTDRLASQVVNPDTRYDAFVGVADNREYKVRKPNEKEIAIQKLIVLFQMTYIGAPHVYYGDEAGMWGADDPDCRKPMVWADMVYNPETNHPFGQQRPADSVAFNADLFSWYQKLIAMRNAEPALRRGSFASIVLDDAKDCMIFKRELNGESIVTAINNSEMEQHIPATFMGARKWQDLITGNEYSGERLLLQAKSGVVLKSSK